MSASTQSPVPQFVVVPQSGLQIFRRLPLRHLGRAEADAVWKTVMAIGYRGGPKPATPLLKLIHDHIACDRIETTGWVAPDLRQSVFYRLIRIGSDYAIDLVVDTAEGAGNQSHNLIRCESVSGWLSKTRTPLANVYVAPNREPRNVVGSLVVDFGNTASTFLFFPAGEPPLNARPLPIHNPFDPWESDAKKRPADQRALLRSTMLLLRVPDSPHSPPWLLLGRPAEELIATLDPHITSLYAPKKYIRDWPAEMKSMEPTVACQGMLGQRTGLVPVLDFVRETIKQMLTLAVSSQTNPRFASLRPEYYPQVREILLTYPLTWRRQEKELFAKLVSDAADSLFALDPEIKRNFRVELICSEPAAVAAFALWQVFFQYYSLAPDGTNLRAPSLVSSLLGNVEGSQSLRLLVLDMGGGSTDIALTQADWSLEPDGVEVQFQMLESMRYNRAGDRISHLIATAILTFFQEKYGVAESLAFNQHPSNPGFKLAYKRGAICAIMELVEQVKAHLSQPGVTEPWRMTPESESDLRGALQQACVANEAVDANAELRLEISLGVLRQWIEADHQSMENRGEPGFMDIFHDLRDLQRSLTERGQLPHLVLLSGRTSRLPFFREMAATYLGMPLHRVVYLRDLLPPALHNEDTPNIDKLAVLHGAHRFRFGSPIRFVPRPEEPIFTRHVGVVQQIQLGFRFASILVKPGEPHRRTCTMRVAASSAILLGHAFRADSSRAEVIATIANPTVQPREVEITIENDFQIKLTPNACNKEIVLTERLSGGAENIVDNFNDTGRIDREPDGWIRKIVWSNRDRWMLR